MESTSLPGKIQISKETYESIKSFGKESWAELRPDAVVAKGKGELRTYIVNSDFMGNTQDSSNRSTSLSIDSESVEANDDPDFDGRRSKNRLIEWSVELLAEFLKQIVARRGNVRSSLPGTAPVMQGNILSEVKEIIMLPKFSSSALHRQNKAKDTELPPNIMDQLRDLVSTISSLYCDNYFHNFGKCQKKNLSPLSAISPKIVTKTFINVFLSIIFFFH